MMYNNQVVACVKSNGKILRELGDKVLLPFGSEYSVFIKNLSTRKAEAKVTIDGKDILNGKSLVLDAYSSMDLERFVTENLNEGNRFKFIERTSSIEKHRGIEAEDGLVRIEFSFEKEKYIAPQNPYLHTKLGGTYNPLAMTEDFYFPRSVMRSSGSHCTDLPTPMYGGISGANGTSNPWVGTATCGDVLDSSISAQSFSATSMNINAVSAQVKSYVPTTDVGITVPGSVSDQKFSEVRGLDLEAAKHVIILRLFGQLQEQRVTQTVTVKHKPKCITCGKQNKADAKFCSECATALMLF